jgi:hypothetical protein
MWLYRYSGRPRTRRVTLLQTWSVEFTFFGNPSNGCHLLFLQSNFRLISKILILSNLPTYLLQEEKTETMQLALINHRYLIQIPPRHNNGKSLRLERKRVQDRWGREELKAVLSIPRELSFLLALLNLICQYASVDALALLPIIVLFHQVSLLYVLEESGLLHY